MIRQASIVISSSASCMRGSFSTVRGAGRCIRHNNRIGIYAPSFMVCYSSPRPNTNNNNYYAFNSSSNFHTSSIVYRKRSSKSQRRRRMRKEETQQLSNVVDPYTAPLDHKQSTVTLHENEPASSSSTGRRPVMTNERINDILSSSSQRDTSLPIAIIDKHMTDNAKHIVHNLQGKMLFKQHYTHTAEAGRQSHNQYFYATLHTTMDQECIKPGGGGSSSIELINIGAARSKKRAETLAAADLLVNMIVELGIDIHDPPDISRAVKEQKDIQFKDNVQKAQMILEVLNVSRPMFDTEEYSNNNDTGGENVSGSGSGKADGFISTMHFYCRGTPIFAYSTELDVIGRSKAEAEGYAMLAATTPGSILEQFVGKKKMDSIRTQIEGSPAGHVAGLHIPTLPEEALDILMDVGLGDNAEHWERMEEHAMLKKRYDEEYYQRQQQTLTTQSDNGKSLRELIDIVNKKSEYDDDLKKLNDVFRKEEETRNEKALSNPEGKQGQMKSIRDALPIKAIQEDLIDALKSQQVVVVSGGTGSGKSTQCPQYILEDAINNDKGPNARIVVTQPRRIAAVSVAERIANERDQEIGTSVGYSVRFNTKPPRSSASIEFVTTGVLLRRLINDPALEGISHVMIDEVHERDIDTDFLLVLLKDLLVKRPELRVILMSATLDAESFGDYFSSCNKATNVPVLSVPTKPRHPVEVFFLEDMSGEDLPQTDQETATSLLRLHDLQLQYDLEEAIAEDTAALKLEARSIAEDDGLDEGESSSDSDSDSDDDKDRCSLPSRRVHSLRRAVSMRSGRSQGKNVATRMRQKVDKREVGELTTRLVAKVAQHVAKVETDASRKGSILCFLPGLDEIKEAMAILEEESDPFLKKMMKILPLHSTIPQHDQQKVFIPADYGTVKIILATNIAESSVTIDDVLSIVDSGLVREMNWDAEKNMSTMVTVPTSKASATQRLGRAGRVAPGRCYRLYSRGQHEGMNERPLPEIQRSALEATCLKTCTMTDDKVQTFLSRALDPPLEEAVEFSMNRLSKLGAIAASPGGEELTPLGHCLSRLPLDPAIGKMLIMGVTMQCLDPIVTAAALACNKDIFVHPPGERKAQMKARQTFDQSSDTLAALIAYDEYQDRLRDEGWDSTRKWAHDNFISIHAVNSIRAVRSQLITELHRLGLVHNSDLTSKSRGKNKELRHNAPVNINSGVQSLYTAIWACGAPDNLAARRRLSSFGTLRSAKENHSGLHPSSVAFHRKPPKTRSQQLPSWFLYREMVLSSQVFLRGATSMTPEQVLLFGGYELSGDVVSNVGGRGHRTIDDWIIVEGKCTDSVNVLSNARREVNAALDLKLMYPRRPLPESYQLVVDALGDSFDQLGDYPL